MAIMRYSPRNPWHELEQLTRGLGQVLGSDWPTPAASGSWMPAINVEESGDELLVTAEVPGMNPNEIDVEIDNNILTIRGEKSEEHTEGDDKKRYHVWERRYGSFERSFELPDGATPSSTPRRTIRGSPPRRSASW